MHIAGVPEHLKTIKISNSHDHIYNMLYVVRLPAVGVWDSITYTGYAEIKLLY